MHTKQEQSVDHVRVISRPRDHRLDRDTHQLTRLQVLNAEFYIVIETLVIF